MTDKLTVSPATVFNQENLYSSGCAKYMLMRQHQFPYKFTSQDHFHEAYNDRIDEWYGYKATKEIDWWACNPRGENFNSWLRHGNVKELQTWLELTLRADHKIKWTGFRIVVETNRATGYLVYSYQLFANVTGVPTYSDQRAPNMVGYEEYSRHMGRHIGRDGFLMDFEEYAYYKQRKPLYG